jgi:hypothetical protein
MDEDGVGPADGGVDQRQVASSPCTLHMLADPGGSSTQKPFGP